jgi:hypothetical protein
VRLDLANSSRLSVIVIVTTLSVSAPAPFLLVKERLVVCGVLDIVRKVDQELCKATLSGCIVAEDRGKGCVTERLGKTLPKSLTSTGIVAESRNISRAQSCEVGVILPQEAPNNMLKEADGLLFDKLIDHVAQNCANCVEALVCLTDVGQADVIKQYFLNDEDGNGLAEFGTRLHNAKAEGDDLGGEEEVDHFGRVILN